MQLNVFRPSAHSLSPFSVFTNFTRACPFCHQHICQQLRMKLWWLPFYNALRRRRKHLWSKFILSEMLAQSSIDDWTRMLAKICFGIHMIGLALVKYWIIWMLCTRSVAVCMQGVNKNKVTCLQGLQYKTALWDWDADFPQTRRSDKTLSRHTKTSKPFAVAPGSNPFLSSMHDYYVLKVQKHCSFNRASV